MVGSFHISLGTSITLSWLRSRLVLAILLAPFDFIVTSTADMFVRESNNLVRLFALWVMLEGECILMLWGMAFFLRFLIVDVGLWHDAIVFVLLNGIES